MLFQAEQLVKSQEERAERALVLIIWETNQFVQHEGGDAEAK